MISISSQQAVMYWRALKVRVGESEVAGPVAALSGLAPHDGPLAEDVGQAVLHVFLEVDAVFGVDQEETVLGFFATVNPGPVALFHE